MSNAPTPEQVAFFVVRPMDDGTWGAMIPGPALIGGFETRKAAHAWVLDYLVEYGRMNRQQELFAREHMAEREWERMHLNSLILDPGKDGKVH